MLDPKRLDELARNLATAVPGVGELQQELERTFQALLQSTFAKLELVTREEFEVQAEVLARSRARLEQLERQVAALEQQMAQERSGA